MLAAGIAQDTFAGEAVEGEGGKEETTGGYFYCCFYWYFTTQARKSSISLEFNRQCPSMRMPRNLPGVRVCRGVASGLL